MPQLNTARPAHSTPTSAFSWGIAYGAGFVSSVGKIFAVLRAVARNTKCFTVGDIKSHLWEFSPRFYVMRMNNSLLSASYASVVVPLKNLNSPVFQTQGSPCSFSLKRRTIFPCRSILANHMLNPAIHAAILLPLVLCVKLLFAIRASVNVRIPPAGPALLRAIFGGFGSVWENKICAAADRANKFYLLFFCCHRETIPQYLHTVKIDPHYVDVIIPRWQDFTGKQAVHAESGKTFDEVKADRAD